MQLHGRTLDLRSPQLVAIVNLTPDSFSDGGELPTLTDVLRRVEQLCEQGADLLDLGGESTRPGAQAVDEQEEVRRVVPAVAAIAARFSVPIAVDTRRASVARAVLGCGAAMINDVSGFSDPAMADAVRAAGAAWVLMHMPHAVGQMQASLRTAAIPADVDAAIDAITLELQDSVARAVQAGVLRSQLAIDPGLGFGKSVAQNLALLLPQPRLASLGLPLYLGPSRKSFLAAVSRDRAIEKGHGKPRELPANDRLGATAAAVTAAVLANAAFVRVHDVAIMRQVIDIATSLRDGFSTRQFLDATVPRP